MKTVRLIIHEPLINKIVGSELSLSLDDQATLVDAIREVDKRLDRKGSFPVPGYQSLLHMIYNPIANGFYKQVAIVAHTESGQMLNLRDDPEKELPEGTAIILIPTGG